MYLVTFHYRIKDTNHRTFLKQKAKSVNLVWNYCNETSFNAIKRDCGWLSNYDLCDLTAGASVDLKLNSQTIQCVSKQYVQSRKQFKKAKLKWRSKKSLGWIPFTNQAIKVENNRVVYMGRTFKFWNSQKFEGVLKCGSFNQDSEGKWFVNLVCEVEGCSLQATSNSKIGIDLGLKTLATTSSGQKYSRPNLTKEFEDKLAMAQRAKKRRQISRINKRIAYKRSDFNHKLSTQLVKENAFIFVGDVSSSRLVRTRLAKSINDASWFSFKQMLHYKSIKNGVTYLEVNERFSTITCSECFKRTGPSGLSDLGVREWTCSECCVIHDRDTNAAKNILRFGHETLNKGVP